MSGRRADLDARMRRHSRTSIPPPVSRRGWWHALRRCRQLPAAVQRARAERQRDPCGEAPGARSLDERGDCRRRRRGRDRGHLAPRPGSRALDRGCAHRGCRPDGADVVRVRRACRQPLAGAEGAAAALESRDEKSCRRRLHREVRGLRAADPAAPARAHAQGLSPHRGNDQVGRAGLRARGHRRDDGGLQAARRLRLLEREADPRRSWGAMPQRVFPKDATLGMGGRRYLAPGGTAAGCGDPARRRSRRRAERVGRATGARAQEQTAAQGAACTLRPR